MTNWAELKMKLNGRLPAIDELHMAAYRLDRIEFDLKEERPIPDEDDLARDLLRWCEVASPAWPWLLSDLNHPVAGHADFAIVVGVQVLFIDRLGADVPKGSLLSVGPSGAIVEHSTGHVFEEGRSQFGGSWSEVIDEHAELRLTVCVEAEEAKVLRNVEWFKADFRVVEHARIYELLADWWKVIPEYDRTVPSPEVLNSLISLASHQSRDFDLVVPWWSPQGKEWDPTTGRFISTALRDRLDELEEWLEEETLD